MVDGYKIVTVTPSGRRKYLKILVKYLLKMSNIIDKHIFWINTNVKENIEYIENLVKEYPDFFECRYLENHPPQKIVNGNIHNFFKDCKDPNTIYVRFDDDIVFIELEEFCNFLKFRIDNPQYFLVYANIINNSMLYFIHQRIGAIKTGYNADFDELPPVEYTIDNMCLRNSNCALNSFICFVEAFNNNNLDIFKFDKWILQSYERVSINCISWLGSEFSKFENVGKDEEAWLSQYKPRELEKPNCIYGNFVVVHYSYGDTRKELDELKNPTLTDYFYKLADKYISSIS